MTRTDQKPDKIDLTEVLGPDPDPAAGPGDVEILDSGSGQAARPAPPGADAERERLQDLYVRTRADFDNFRKRVEREHKDFTEWAAADVLSDVLAVINR